MALSVNGELVDEALMRAEANAIRVPIYEGMEGEDPRTIEARVKEWSRANVIERVLLRQAALEDAVANATTGTPEELIEGFIAKITKNVARPRHKDVVDYYRKNREQLWAPETARAAHIVKQVDDEHPEEAARAAIEEILTALSEGGSFEELADQRSDRPGDGGSLGVFRRGEMERPFEDAAFQLEPGCLSGVVRTSFGFHIIKLFGKRAAGIPKLDEIREGIEEAIFRQKKQKVIEQFLDRLLAKSDIRDV